MYTCSILRLRVCFDLFMSRYTLPVLFTNCLQVVGVTKMFSFDLHS